MARDSLRPIKQAITLFSAAEGTVMTDGFGVDPTPHRSHDQPQRVEETVKGKMHLLMQDTT